MIDYVIYILNNLILNELKRYGNTKYDTYKN